jgi:NADH:ubiquinone oxidoreductase subunit 3 (subunit A)
MSMMEGFAVIYAFVLIGILFASVTLIAAKLLRPKVEYDRKLTTYECGIPATGTTEVNLNIRFYVFALLFVIFDVETLFVYPWAVTAREMGAVALAEMGVFLAILFLGLAYAWAKGALVWE